MNELERIAKIAGVSFNGTSNHETFILEDAKVLNLIPEKDPDLVPALSKGEFELALHCFEKILDQNANADYIDESLWGALKAAVQVGTKDIKAGAQKAGGKIGSISNNVKDVVVKAAEKKVAEISRVYQSGEMQKVISDLQDAKKGIENFWKKLQASKGFKGFDEKTQQKFKNTLEYKVKSLDRFIRDLNVKQNELK